MYVINVSRSCETNFRQKIPKRIPAAKGLAQLNKQQESKDYTLFKETRHLPQFLEKAQQGSFRCYCLTVYINTWRSNNRHILNFSYHGCVCNSCNVNRRLDMVEKKLDTAQSIEQLTKSFALYPIAQQERINELLQLDRVRNV